MSYCQGSGCSQNPGIAKNFLGGGPGGEGVLDIAQIC